MNFTEITDNQLPAAAKAGMALIDFYAPWCTSCTLIAPAVAKVAAQEPGLCVCKCDIDANAALAERFAVMSVPTLVILKDGAEADRMVGVHSAADILSRLAGVLA